MKLISIRTISLKAFSEWLKKEIRSSGSVAKKFFFFPLNHTSSPPFLPPYRKTLERVLIRERVIELCFKSFRYEATLYILTRRIRRVHECSRVKKVGVGKRRKIWRYGRGERGYKEIWNGLRWSAFINPCTRPERILCVTRHKRRAHLRHSFQEKKKWNVSCIVPYSWNEFFPSGFWGESISHFWIATARKWS